MSTALSGIRRAPVSGTCLTLYRLSNSMFSGIDATTLFPPVSMTLTAVVSRVLASQRFGLHVNFVRSQAPPFPHCASAVQFVLQDMVGVPVHVGVTVPAPGHVDASAQGTFGPV